MEYRAQVGGRCQRQYIKEQVYGKLGAEQQKPAVLHWIDEWTSSAAERNPFTAASLQPHPDQTPVEIEWRLITNSGSDEGFIRPVIGAGGWPLVPGSSIKGLFRRACQQQAPHRVSTLCGGVGPDGETQPGILRFHGAWPVDQGWKHGLLDLAHPQQNWQVGIPPVGHSANAVVSLYQPKLCIPISSKNPSLATEEWTEICSILHHALTLGIGGRTCVGYGSSGRVNGDLVYECSLEGQGPAAKLLDGTPEFRPTMFRAAIRGMALRLFGGVTDAKTARHVVGRLFGSISPDDDKDVNVGLLATAYTDATSELGRFGWTNYRQHTYATSGRLQWRRMRDCERNEDEALVAELLCALHGITMSLGGFGRGWRRPDHRIFRPKYDKTPIGCHWQWRDASSLPSWVHVQSPEALARLLQRSRQLARRWLEATGEATGGPAPWREVLHPAQMVIWTRTAQGPIDAKAVAWFHQGKDDDKAGGQLNDPCNLKGSDLAGKMNQVGLIWNRLLPLLAPVDNPSEAEVIRPANPTARPANPMARPANRTARPSASRQPARQPQGDVSIAAHQGAYLESLVLHSLSRDALHEAQEHHKRFSEEMDRGARANFVRLKWS